MQVTPNVYVETGFMGSNVSYVATAEGVVLIDAPFRPTDALKWRKQIESKGTVKYLINTEPHDDHTIGGFFFNVPVVAHEKTREAIKSLDVDEILQTIAMIDPDGVSLVKDFQFNIPAITYSKHMTIYLGSHSFHLINLPGHTAGETAVFVPEERVLFTGDNVTCREHGFLHQAEPYAWLESLQRMEELDVDYIIPGHGEVCDKSYLAQEASYIQDCINAVKGVIDQGWTKEEAVARLVMPQPYPFEKGVEEIGKQLVKMSIANLYDKLSQK